MLTISILLIGAVVHGFPTNHLTSSTIGFSSRKLSFPLLSAGKGFGELRQDGYAKRDKKSISVSVGVEVAKKNDNVGVTTTDDKTHGSGPKISAFSDTSARETLNSGQLALEKLRRERAEQYDSELRKVREMMIADQQISTSPAVIPEKVAMRMGRRMLPFVGVPFCLGMLSFVGFWYMATYKDLEFQPALVATSTIVLLGLGLLVSGNKKGSFLIAMSKSYIGFVVIVSFQFC